MMHNILFFVAIFFGFENISCTCNKSPQVIHMSYFDIVNTTYNMMDSNHLNPLQEKTIYFRVNQEKAGCIKDGFLTEFIKNDSFMQKEIQNKYPTLDILFYKKSENTDHLMQSKLSKNLSYCNDDIVAEYVWNNGTRRRVIRYENGKVDSAQEISIKSIK